MCCEDIAIGRRTMASEIRVPVALTATPLVAQSRERIALIVSNPGARRAHIGTDKNIGNQEGIPIPARGGPVVILIEDYGSLVMQAWYGCTDTQPDTLTVMEVLSDDCEQR